MNLIRIGNLLINADALTMAELDEDGNLQLTFHQYEAMEFHASHPQTAQLWQMLCDMSLSTSVPGVMPPPAPTDDDTTAPAAEGKAIAL